MPQRKPSRGTQKGTIDTVGQIHVPVELITTHEGRSTFAALVDTHEATRRVRRMERVRGRQ